MSLRNYLAERVGKKRPVDAPETEPQRAEDKTPAAQNNDIGGLLSPENKTSDGESSGEPGAMPATVDTLDRTHAYDDAQAALGTVPYANPDYANPSPVNPERPDGYAMRFTYASGAKPLQGYTIKRGVGVGGFGEVYFAVSDAGKEVALKRVQRNLEVELRGVSHCLNLKHPNLISLFDIRFDESGQAWIVMEYVAGQSMRAALDLAPNGLSEAEAMRWFTALAAGVSHLHEAGIVHRDLKPGNIFDDDGIVKIGDYGLSKYISCSRRGGHTESVGTFHYMAPEVGRGNYGREIDIYAMGIILHELLTGTVPFDGESSHEIVMKHLTANPDLSAIGEPYRSVIWQALQKNPSSRQQTVAQMVRPLGIELDECGIARANSTRFVSLPNPAHAAVVGNGDQLNDDIVFDPPPATSRPTAARQTAANGNEIRFGEVRYHQPAKAPLAGVYPAQAIAGQNGHVAQRPARREEPLARAMRGTARDLGRWWTSLEPFPGTRIVLLVMGIALLVMNTQWLLPLLTLMAIVYVPYYIIRAIVLGISGSTTTAPAYPAYAVPRQRPRLMTLTQWRNQQRTVLATKPSSIRAAEFGGSSTSAVFACGLLAVGLGMFGLWDRSATGTAVAPYVWSGMIAALATGIVLGLGKLWEREEGSSFTRRMVLLGTGSAVGACGYWLANFLMIPLDENVARNIEETNLPLALYTYEGEPRLAAMMAHFALLLGGLRWWTASDPLRTRRLSLWKVAVAVVGAWGVQQLLPIPQPMGMMTAGIIAVATQFAAPWENPKRQLREVNRNLRVA